jgi:hypothetical protein
LTIEDIGGNTLIEGYVDEKISDLVNTAPETLDTLNELAAALGNDPNFATTVAEQIGKKVSKSGDTMTGLLTGPRAHFTSITDAQEEDNTNVALRLGDENG